jgi:hypothetical protein
LPVGLGVVLVAVVLPCVDFVGGDFLVGDAAIQKLPSFSMTGATRPSVAPVLGYGVALIGYCGLQALLGPLLSRLAPTIGSWFC